MAYREPGRVYVNLDPQSIRGQRVVQRELELKSTNKYIVFIGWIAAVVELVVLYAGGYIPTLALWLVITTWLLRQNRRELRKAYVAHIESIECELYGHTRVCSDPFKAGCGKPADLRYQGADYCFRCHEDHMLGLRFPD